MSSIEYKRRADPPIVRVTSDDGTQREWPLATFEADPAACIAATGNGINAPVPETISAPQARVALHRVGLLANVNALVNDPSTPEEVKIFWEYEPNLNRDSPALNAMAGLLGLNDAALDDLFRSAAEIRV